ncbi:MAG: DsbA family protein [Nitrospira sp.]|nr:DsbA family protein [Nitrospira sp.]
MKYLSPLILPMIALAILAPTTNTKAGDSYSNDPAWRQAVDAAIQQYIRTHPEAIVEAIQAMEIKKKAEEHERSQKQITAHHTELLKDPTSPTSGNPNGDVTVVEFFDYRCLFCKQAAGAVTQLQTEDRNVRVVYKDFPILGELSVLAAKAALAAHTQDKHQQFHEALLASEVELTREEMIAIAKRIGLDVKRLETAMQSPELQATLDRNLALGFKLGISGTPGFIVGTELKPGALNLKELRNLVERARKSRVKEGKS